MGSKRMRLVFSISLMVTGVTALVINVCNIFSLPLPDVVVRVLGIVGIIAAAVLAFAFVRLYITNKQDKA